MHANPVIDAERHMAEQSMGAAERLHQEWLDEQLSSVIRAALQSMPRHLRTEGVCKSILVGVGAFIADTSFAHKDFAQGAVEYVDSAVACFEDAPHD